MKEKHPKETEPEEEKVNSYYSTPKKESNLYKIPIEPKSEKYFLVTKRKREKTLIKTNIFLKSRLKSGEKYNDTSLFQTSSSFSIKSPPNELESNYSSSDVEDINSNEIYYFPNFIPSLNYRIPPEIKNSLNEKEKNNVNDFFYLLKASAKLPENHTDETIDNDYLLENSKKVIFNHPHCKYELIDYTEEEFLNYWNKWRYYIGNVELFKSIPIADSATKKQKIFFVNTSDIYFVITLANNLFEANSFFLHESFENPKNKYAWMNLFYVLFTNFFGKPPGELEMIHRTSSYSNTPFLLLYLHYDGEVLDNYLKNFAFKPFKFQVDELLMFDDNNCMLYREKIDLLFDVSVLVPQDHKKVPMGMLYNKNEKSHFYISRYPYFSYDKKALIRSNNSIQKVMSEIRKNKNYVHYNEALLLVFYCCPEYFIKNYNEVIHYISVYYSEKN